MFRLKYIKICFLFILVMVMISGCTIMNQEKKLVNGEIFIPPSNCITCSCPDFCDGDEIPVANAEVKFVDENGQIILATTDQCGQYQVALQNQNGYLLYATAANMVVKQFLTIDDSDKDIIPHRANAYTTAQVILYETALQLFPDSLTFRDIPFLTPGSELLNSVISAYSNCVDPSQDSAVLALAETAINAMFGASGACIPCGSTNSFVTPTPSSSPTPSPTPSPTCPTCTTPQPPTPPINPNDPNQSQQPSNPSNPQNPDSCPNCE